MHNNKTKKSLHPFIVVKFVTKKLIKIRLPIAFHKHFCHTVIVSISIYISKKEDRLTTLKKYKNITLKEY